MESQIKTTEANTQGQTMLLQYLQENGSPNVNDVVHYHDVVQVFKSGNQQLLQLLITADGINALISLLHTSKDYQIVRRVLQLFTMVDSPLLHELIDSIEFTENLLQIFDSPEPVHPYIVGAISQILFVALESFPGDVYEDLNASRTIFPRIIKSIELNSIYYLCTRLVITSIDSQTFCWVLFCSLMGDHGPGCAIPKSFAYDPAAMTPPIALTPAMRKKVIELLFSFFNEFPDTCDFYNDISTALPLILQDASDDAERALVFKLGLLLNINEAIAYSAQSVLNCMKSSDMLIQYSLYYIHSFGVIIRNSSVELILYRLLHREPNNFVLIVLGKMIQSIIEGNKDKSDLTESLEMIIADAYQNAVLSSPIQKAFRMFLFCASEGVDPDPNSQFCFEQLRKFNENPMISEIDKDYIAQLKKKADFISSSDSFLPVFTVANLWQQDYYQKMEEKFKSLSNQTTSKAVLTPGDEIRPNLPKPETHRTPTKLHLPTSVPPASAPPLPPIEEEEEEYSDDNYYEEETTDESEQLKLREMIERQKAVKAQAAEKVEPQGIEVEPVQKKVASILDLPPIPPAPKPVEKPAEKQTKTKTKSAKKSRKSSKAKSKASKKTQKTNTATSTSVSSNKPRFSFSNNLGVIDSPPSKQPLQSLELNISTLKLKPRKPKPVFDRKVLVIDCPFTKPSLSINITNEFETEDNDSFLSPSPKKHLSNEEIRKMLIAATNDPEEDFDIEPLPSEMEEEDDDATPIRNPFFVYTSNQNEEEEDFFEEELQNEPEQEEPQTKTVNQ